MECPTSAEAVEVRFMTDEPSLCHQMMTKMNHMRRNRCLCDINLSADGVVFPAHRIVIATASDFFQQLFTSLYPETPGTNHIYQIPSLSAADMEHVLNFMYTGQVDLRRENIQHYLTMASRLQISTLVDVCKEFLILQLQQEQKVQSSAGTLTLHAGEARAGETGSLHAGEAQAGETGTLHAGEAQAGETGTLHVGEAQAGETGSLHAGEAQAGGDGDAQMLMHSDAVLSMPPVKEDVAPQPDNAKVVSDGLKVDSSITVDSLQLMSAELSDNVQPVATGTDEKTDITTMSNTIQAPGIGNDGQLNNAETTENLQPGNIQPNNAETTEMLQPGNIQPNNAEACHILQPDCADSTNDGQASTLDVKMQHNTQTQNNLIGQPPSDASNDQPLENEEKIIENPILLLKEETTMPAAPSVTVGPNQRLVLDELTGEMTIVDVDDDVDESTDDIHMADEEEPSNENGIDMEMSAEKKLALNGHSETGEEQLSSDVSGLDLNHESELTHQTKASDCKTNGVTASDNQPGITASDNQPGVTASDNQPGEAKRVDSDLSASASRKRGRPRKNPAEGIKENVAVEGGTESPVLPTPRKRGRPKKTVTETETKDENIDSDALECPPAKRGRPRKNSQGEIEKKKGDEALLTLAPDLSDAHKYGTRSRSGVRTPARPRTELVSVAMKAATKEENEDTEETMSQSAGNSQKKECRKKNLKSYDRINKFSDSASSGELPVSASLSDSLQGRDDDNIDVKEEGGATSREQTDAETSQHITTEEKDELDVKEVFSVNEEAEETSHLDKVQKGKLVGRKSKSELPTLQVCEWCGAERSDLRHHILWKHPDKVKKCEHCPLRFYSDLAYDYHIIKSHQVECVDGEYVCPFQDCTYRAKIKSYTNHHIKRSHKPFVARKCDDCDQTLADGINFHEHRLTAHGVVPEKQEVLRCLHCSYVTLKREKLKRHSQNSHTSMEDMHICDICQKVFPAKEALQTHRRRVHCLNPKFHQCEFCKYQARKKSALYSHRYHEHGERHPDHNTIHRCRYCSFTDVIWFLVKKHEDRSHVQVKERKFLCMYCPKAFLKRDSLDYHEATHNKTYPLPFCCERCGYRCRTRGQLKKHITYVHSDVRPYLCDNCGYTTKAKGNLGKHMRICQRLLDKNLRRKRMMAESHRKPSFSADATATDTKQTDVNEQANLEIVDSPVPDAVVQLMTSVMGIADSLPEGGATFISGSDLQHGEKVAPTEEGVKVEGVLLTENSESLVIAQEQVYPVDGSELSDAVSYIIVNQENFNVEFQ